MPATPDSTLPDVRRSTADLQRELAEVRRKLDERTQEHDEALHEVDEALQRETATAEVLGVINSSPGNLDPVFDAILEKAHELCGADFGGLLIYDGEDFRLAAEHNLPPAWADFVRGPDYCPGPNYPMARLARGEPLIQIEDMAEVAARSPDDPIPRAGVELGGIRTILFVP